MSEYGDEILHDGHLSATEILQIQKAYRRRRLLESLIGPIASTTFHVALMALLAIFITDKPKTAIAEIEVQIEEVEVVELEPPPIEEPEEVEVEEPDASDPVVTTVKVENFETEDTALEDTNDDAPSTDDNMIDDNTVSDIVVSPSAYASSSVYGGRSAAGRASAVRKNGGSKAGQESLLKALEWLKNAQNPDGSWGNRHQPAFTGLALLTFLAYGETPLSRKYGPTVKKAMRWLTSHEISIGAKKSAYNHAIKTYALAEAYAMTGISLLEGPMNAHVRVVIDGQQKGGCYDYGYSTDEKRQDLSLAGWNYQALKAAYSAGCQEKGLEEAINKGIKWLRNASAGDGQFPYATQHNRVQKVKTRHTMRAVGCLCLQLFGEGESPEIKDDLDVIANDDFENLNWQKPPRESLYGWYYATQAMFQAGGRRWKKWNKRFEKELIDNQNPEGYWEYPGDFHGVKTDLNKKVYATTLCALMLTVYYRYLPSSQVVTKRTEKKKEPVEETETINLFE